MSGFGSQPLGSFLIGGDTPVETETGEAIVPPNATLYDISTREFPVDPTSGLLEGVHPVDQKVALALGIQAGRIKSVPTQGTDFSTLTRLTVAQKQFAAERLIRSNSVITSLVTNGDITIESIEYGSPGRGNDQVGFVYTNNRTKKRQIFNG